MFTTPMLVVQQTANDTVDVAFVILVVLRMRQGRGAVVDCTGATRTVVVTCGGRVAPNTGSGFGPRPRNDVNVPAHEAELRPVVKDRL